jgi:hypothetical protein
MEIPRDEQRLSAYHAREEQNRQAAVFELAGKQGRGICDRLSGCTALN